MGSELGTEEDEDDMVLVLRKRYDERVVLVYAVYKEEITRSVASKMTNALTG